MSFENDRLKFADQLRHLREQAGMTGKELAARLGWLNSKVSKIERGKQTPTDDDVIAWTQATEAPSERAEELRDQLRDLRIEQIAWRRQVREGHRRRQEEDQRSEADASVIRALDTAAVPGLLQTPEYARWIFRSQAELLQVPADDIEESVRARMERQRVLYEPDKTIEILMLDSVLTHPVCPPAALAGQIDRLTTVVGLPNVRFGIIPAVRLPHVPWHGFWIVDDTVYIELVSEEIRVKDPDQVAIYRRMLDALWTVAVEGDDARALLLRLAKHYADADG